MLEIEITQEPSGGWMVRTRAEQVEWFDHDRKSDAELPEFLALIGRNINDSIREAHI